MEEVLCEPVELTEFELDAVAGGNPFSQNGVAVALSQSYEYQNLGQIKGKLILPGRFRLPRILAF
jgi:hypothetical protein